ncbi:MAG: hypothetical protein JO019_04670, partial [Candidatus Kaiserbacteria bacterium]|nr:hypothetical protein [Candidatus Kaiserbacteria bacterium]
MTLWNRACAIAFEVSFLLFLLLAVIAPFHAAATKHLTVVQTVDATHALIEGDVSHLSVGQRIALYRFNHDWKTPIGEAQVTHIGAGAAEIEYDASHASWPIGHHALVSEDAGSNAFVSLGSDNGITQGEYLNLYRDRKNVGQAQVIALSPTRAEIRLPVGIGSTEGLVASEFTFATQAAVYDAPTLSAIELFLTLMLFGAYIYYYVRLGSSPIVALGERLRRIALPQRAIFWGVNVLIAIPFAWFMSKMPLYLGAYVISYIQTHLFSAYSYLYPAADRIYLYLFAIELAAYLAYLIWQKRSPVIAFWRFISYKGKSKAKTDSLTRGILLWALHLIIVYAFASTLWGFLRGDINATLSFGFPAPSLEAFFEQMKFAIWALTVVGVLIGYGYSVVSVLWGSYIRNLDFTVTGWLTNGFCYPLFGVVI